MQEIRRKILFILHFEGKNRGAFHGYNKEIASKSPKLAK